MSYSESYRKWKSAGGMNLDVQLGALHLDVFILSVALLLLWIWSH